MGPIHSSEAIFIGALGLHAFGVAGYSVGVQDLSQRSASLISGTTVGIGIMSGAASQYITGALLDSNGRDCASSAHQLPIRPVTMRPTPAREPLFFLMHRTSGAPRSHHCRCLLRTDTRPADTHPAGASCSCLPSRCRRSAGWCRRVCPMVGQ